jgi:hypothetical protein
MTAQKVFSQPTVNDIYLDFVVTDKIRGVCQRVIFISSFASIWLAFEHDSY